VNAKRGPRNRKRQRGGRLTCWGGEGRVTIGGKEQPRHEESMYRVTREIRFCYGHRLLNHAGKCRHLHGHNGRAVLVLEAARLDGLGMVMDFGRIKQIVSAW